MKQAMHVRKRGWATKNLEPFKQGSLDGLCGVYAILNAIKLLHSDLHLETQEATELFRKLLVKKLEKRSKKPTRIASHVIDGVTSGVVLDLIKMAKNDASFTLGKTLIKQRTRKKTIEAIKTEMRAKLNDGYTILCGVTGRVNHWTVINNHTEKRFTTFDSGYVKAIPLDKIRGHFSATDDGYYHIHASDVFYLKMKKGV